MKDFKAFIKPYEAPQRSFKLIFSRRPGSGWDGLISTIKLTNLQ